MTLADKPLVWLHGEVKTPPFAAEARIGAGVLLRRLQRGERLGLPAYRPMPMIGRRCHEWRIRDAGHTWRVIYRLDEDAVVIARNHDGILVQTVDDAPCVTSIPDPPLVAAATNHWHRAVCWQAETFAALQPPKQHTCADARLRREGRCLDLAVQPDERLVGESHSL